MEITELMIGDMILYEGAPTRVYGINESTVKGKSVLNIINYRTDGYYGVFYIREDEAYPIQLTGDILKKIGFKLNCGVYQSKSDTGKRFSSIEIQDYGDNGFYVDAYSSKNEPNSLIKYSGTIRHLHELQHILNIVKINLAISM